MTDSSFAAGQVEKGFRALDAVEDVDRLVELERRVDALEKRFKEIISQLAWLVEVTP